MARRKEGIILPTNVLWSYSANKEGLHPVKIRIIHQKVAKYYTVITPQKEKLFLSEKDYNYIIETPIQKLRGKNRLIRSVIDDAVHAAKEAISEATSGGKSPFSFSLFERKYLGADASRNFLAYFEGHIKKLKKKGQA
ncbi:MAG: hypothetical protein KDC93_18835, partial [Cyclobacteriaceae bacterium]|nr:hypothetical protein [Cyclobacteriaceae bacterium]